ncbi:hypothetical protein EUGRSUZ_I00328 [Eucalyptus grandis]|uniref:Uncharacterized protein n=2 Tax=Eucalyptus grandis TaxID=71139 RepID=A0A059AK47_EUCGR|nr:hypothetical protein EUGRSUZ_I00328 [Eucalyptus grandis]
MVEFGDELVVQSLRIPWLIWIQLLVMLLLLLLLCSLTSSPSDDPSSAAAAADAPSSSSSTPASSRLPPVEPRGSPPPPSPPRARKQQFVVHGAHQVSESQSVKGFIAMSASRRVAVEEDEIEGDNSSHGYMDHHPCSIVRLARMAFLKCLGLDFTSENSSFKRHSR